MFFHGYRMCSYIIQKQRDPSKAHQMKLEVIVKALKWLEIDMDLDEVPFDGLICHYYITWNFIGFSVQHFYLSDECH